MRCARGRFDTYHCQDFNGGALRAIWINDMLRVRVQLRKGGKVYGACARVQLRKG